MTDAATQTATTEAPEFTATQISHAQELNTVIRDADGQGSAALVAQAIALHDLKETESWRALTDDSGIPFETWTDYHTYAAPTKSPANVSKAMKVIGLLGKDNDTALMAQAGIEKLYTVLGLIDKKVPGVTLSNAVEFAVSHTAIELRKLGEGSGSAPDTVALVGFKVSKATHERFNSVLNNVIGRALKIAGDGKEASDWEKVDAFTEIVANLDPNWITKTVSGEGDGGPRAASTFTDMDPSFVLDWVIEQYVGAGADGEAIIGSMKDRITEIALNKQNEIEAQKLADKAKAEEERKATKKTEANKNKLIKLSSNIEVQTEKGEYLVVDVFKDSNSAHVKTIREGEFVIAEEGGAPVNLDELAAAAVGIKKAPAPKKEKAAPAADTGTRFSKAAQTKKSAAPKKTSAKGKKGE